MSNTIQTGRVSFVSHDKNYIIIEYEVTGKKKVVNGSVDKKNLKTKHVFQIGDTVSFTVGLSGQGDRMAAANIRFMYNTALDALINKAKTENNFIGYLKVVDGKYFVKEIDSYLFFPLPLSPWQIKPTEAELNEAVTFSLENTDKKHKITARLYNNKYIPEFYSVVKLNKTNSPIEATVYKISPHGIYLNLIGDKVQVKIPFREGVKLKDTVTVRIVYLSPFKIIAEEL